MSWWQINSLNYPNPTIQRLRQLPHIYLSLHHQTTSIILHTHSHTHTQTCSSAKITEQVSKTWHHKPMWPVSEVSVRSHWRQEWYTHQQKWTSFHDIHVENHMHKSNIQFIRHEKSYKCILQTCHIDISEIPQKWRTACSQFYFMTTHNHCIYTWVKSPTINPEYQLLFTQQ